MWDIMRFLFKFKLNERHFLQDFFNNFKMTLIHDCKLSCHTVECHCLNFIQSQWRENNKPVIALKFVSIGIEKKLAFNCLY